MGIQTSRITTANNTNLVIQPSGNTKVKSITANNPGTTPLIIKSNDQSINKWVITDLSGKSDFSDNDWVIIHDSSTNTTKKVKFSNI